MNLQKPTLATSRGFTRIAETKAAPAADKALSPKLKLASGMGTDWFCCFSFFCCCCCSLKIVSTFPSKSTLLAAVLLIHEGRPCLGATIGFVQKLLLCLQKARDFEAIVVWGLWGFAGLRDWQGNRAGYGMNYEMRRGVGPHYFGLVSKIELKLNILGKECVIAYVYVTWIRGVELRAPNNWGLISAVDVEWLWRDHQQYSSIFLVGQYNLNFFFSRMDGQCQSKRIFVLFLRGKVTEIWVGLTFIFSGNYARLTFWNKFKEKKLRLVS